MFSPRHVKRGLSRCTLVCFTLLVLAQHLAVPLSAQERTPQKAPELDGGVAWLNTTGPLKLADLRGKVVLLDFWTYCCINCIHILPDLEKLEKKYPNELVVIGVHSAKFNAEKETRNIQEAILRYHIEHPVVNDANHRIWSAYGVSSWPTFWLIDPEGNAVGWVSGEGNLDKLDAVITRLIEKHRQKKTLNTRPIRIALEKDKQMAKGPESPLHYPGKVLADPVGKRIYIADSSNHRIVITDLDGVKIDVAGKGESGNAEGSFEQAQFNDPQGMALKGDLLYVADRKNHQIKELDLKQRKVRIIAGVGMQGRDRATGGPARITAMNSPWDLLLLKDQLFIAMAGHHQIWRLDLTNYQLTPFAGNGNEDIIDGGAGQASFAQPSGLASDGNWLFVADSEVSAIRAVSLNSREVKSLIGSGLFKFGDKDGTGAAVMLQHCLGVAMWNSNVLIADTYNNKIKLLEPKTRQVVTFVGDGKPGNSDSPIRFNEPAGIHVTGDKAYIADTNNHMIRVLDLKKRTVQTLKISGLRPPATVSPRPTFRNLTSVALDPVVLPQSGDVELEFKLNLPPGMKLDASSPISYHVEGFNEGKQRVNETFGELFGTRKLKVSAQTLSSARKLKVSIEYYPCNEGQGVCQVKSQSWEMPVTFTPKGVNTLKLETRGQ